MESYFQFSTFIRYFWADQTLIGDDLFYLFFLKIQIMTVMNFDTCSWKKKTEKIHHFWKGEGKPCIPYSLINKDLFVVFSVDALYWDRSFFVSSVSDMLYLNVIFCWQIYLILLFYPKKKHGKIVYNETLWLLKYMSLLNTWIRKIASR